MLVQLMHLVCALSRSLSSSRRHKCKCILMHPRGDHLPFCINGYEWVWRATIQAMRPSQKVHSWSKTPALTEVTKHAARSDRPQALCLSQPSVTPPPWVGLLHTRRRSQQRDSREDGSACVLSLLRRTHRTTAPLAKRERERERRVSPGTRRLTQRLDRRFASRPTITPAAICIFTTPPTHNARTSAALPSLTTAKLDVARETVWPCVYMCTTPCCRKVSHGF